MSRHATHVVLGAEVAILDRAALGEVAELQDNVELGPPSSGPIEMIKG
ncbi:MULTISPECIES: hypothetical protein [unclassified Thiocapsa]